jgi:transglutaminase-like putative cysteine protease
LDHAGDQQSLSAGNRAARKCAAALQAEVILEPLRANPEAVSEVPAAKLPLEVMVYLYPSRYCQADKLVRFAHSTFGDLASGYRRVNGICNRIRDNVEYQSGVSNSLNLGF